MQDGDLYEIYAVKYGEVAERAMSENMIGGDPHDMSGQLDFYVWAVVGRSRTFIVDTGFNHETAAERNRKLQRLPKEGLALVGVDAGAVRDVIVTHMHYDHAGTLSDFPQRPLPPPGAGDGIRHRPLHVPRGHQGALPCGRRLHDGAQAVCGRADLP